jgi:hypothetical protein
VRDIVDEPERRQRFINALDASLVGWARSKNPSEAAGAAVAAYLRAFEHGYGRPPQALDVKVGNSDGPFEFRILDAAGAAFAFGGGDLPTRSIPLPTEASE